MGDGGNPFTLILCTLSCDKHELKSLALSSSIRRHDVRVCRILTHEEVAELRVHLLYKLAADVDGINWKMGEWMTFLEKEGVEFLHGACKRFAICCLVDLIDQLDGSMRLCSVVGSKGDEC